MADHDLRVMIVEYRARAQQARADAERLGEGPARRKLLDLAATCDAVADELESELTAQAKKDRA
jgi:hypothetical protein